MKHSHSQLLITAGLQRYPYIKKKITSQHRTAVWLPRNPSLLRVSLGLSSRPLPRLSTTLQFTVCQVHKLTLLSNKSHRLTEFQTPKLNLLLLYYKLANFHFFDKAAFSKLFFTLTFLKNLPQLPVRAQKPQSQQPNPLLGYFSKRYL